MVRRLAATTVGIALLGVLAGAAAAAPSPRDTQAPKVQAVDSEGTVDGVTSLRYVVSDDSGRTWEALFIYRDGAVVRRYRTTLGPAVKGRMYGYRLDATPASFRGTFRFCVQSHDAAGNVTKPSCAKVRIR